MHYPIRIETLDHELVERAPNVQSAVTVLYGDLSSHRGEARRVIAPASFVDRLQWEAEVNADCYGIPVDVVIAC